MSTDDPLAGTSVLSIIVGIPVLAIILYFTVGFIWSFLFEFIPETYRAIRYDRHGICGQCKQPYVRVIARQVDQTYGGDVVTQDVCPNGHVSFVHGNRHHADWAGF